MGRLRYLSRGMHVNTSVAPEGNEDPTTEAVLNQGTPMVQVPGW